jgi:hypothetical protein
MSISFSSAFLIDSSNIETIDTGLMNIAVMKEIGDSSQATIQWLACKHEEWLLLFDSADEPSIDLHKFLPQCSHGNIIITSRNPGLCVYAGASSHVSDMEEDEAVELLCRSAALGLTLKNRAAAAAIVKVGLRNVLLVTLPD